MSILNRSVCENFFIIKINKEKLLLVESFDNKNFMVRLGTYENHILIYEIRASNNYQLRVKLLLIKLTILLRSLKDKVVLKM
jgi:hypothetical protein